MEEPDWYPDWRHDAVHQLQAKNAQLEEVFRLGAWPRFYYDLGVGTIIFSDDGGPKVIADVQVAGTTSAHAGNWLWAWGNSHWPEDRVTDSRLVRAFGEKHGICQLTHDFVDDEDDNLNALGWELTAVMVRVTEALGAYRPPDEEGALYLTLANVRWAS